MKKNQNFVRLLKLIMQCGGNCFSSKLHMVYNLCSGPLMLRPWDTLSELWHLIDRDLGGVQQSARRQWEVASRDLRLMSYVYLFMNLPSLPLLIYL